MPEEAAAACWIKILHSHVGKIWSFFFSVLNFETILTSTSILLQLLLWTFCSFLHWVDLLLFGSNFQPDADILWCVHSSPIQKKRKLHFWMSGSKEITKVSKGASQFFLNSPTCWIISFPLIFHWRRWRKKMKRGVVTISVVGFKSKADQRILWFYRSR